LPCGVAGLVTLLAYRGRGPSFRCSWRGCSLARSLLGADYDAGDQAVFAERDAYGILATVYGGSSGQPSET
jgi:hypothetical protein